MRFISCLALALFPLTATSPASKSREQVTLTYDFTVTRCAVRVCKSEIAGHANVYVMLSPENPEYSWGYETMEEQADNLRYQLHFDVSRTSTAQGQETGLRIGFFGETESGKRMTSCDKSFSGKNWVSLKRSRVEAPPYSDGEQTIGPALQILEVHSRIVKLVP